MPAAIPLVVNAAMAYAGYSATAIAVATLASSVVVGQYERHRAEKKARQAYNKNLTDRLMTIRSGVATRRYALGTIRVGGTLIYAETIGPNQTAFDSIVALAANKCSIRDYCLNDESIAAADFPGAKYGQAEKLPASNTFPESGTAGPRTKTLTHAPIPGSTVTIWAVQSGAFDQAVFIPVSSVNGSQVSFNWPGLPGAGWEVSISYQRYGPSKLLAQFKDGDSSQTSTPWADYDSPQWTAAHRLRGVCHVRTLMIWDENVYQQGAPAVGAVLHGGGIDEHPIYDPRTASNVSYSDNPAVLAGWWMTLPRERGGCGIPSDWIDWDTVKVAANICDELITVRTLDGTGYEQVRRYQCHTVLDTADAPLENLDRICSAMAAGRPVFTAGKYRMFAGAFRSATLTITDDMVVGTEPITVVKSNDGAPPNICTATFADATKNHQESSAPVVQNDLYILEDGRKEALDLRLEATTDPRQANYLMGVALEQARPALTCVLHVGGIGEDIALGDTLMLDLTNRSQYTGKTFEVIQIADKWNGTFDLTLREMKSHIWALDADRFTPINQPPPPDLSHLWSVAPILNFQVSFGTPQLFPDGNSITAITLSWDEHSQSYVRASGKIELRYRQVGTSLWAGIPEVPGDATGTVFSASLVDTAAYEFQVRARNGLGAIGPWTSSFGVIEGESIVIASLRIRASSTTFRVDKDGIGEPASITLEPVLGGPLAGPVTWTVVSGTATLGVDGDNRTLAFEDLESFTATIKASATHGSTEFVDYVTIIKVFDGLPGLPGSEGEPGEPGDPGADAVIGLLTNEAIVLPADANGAVTSYANATTTMAVYQGTENDSANWSFTKLEGPGVSSATLVGNVLTINSVSSATDATYVDITATRSGYASITKRVSITKAKRGATGSTGSPGAPGQRGTVQIAVSRTGTGWSDSIANNAILNAGYGSPVDRDVVTIYNTTSAWSEARAYVSGSWVPIGAYISGSLLVDDSVLARHVAARQLEGGHLKVGGIKAADSVIDVSAIGTLQVAGNAVTTMNQNNGGTVALVANSNVGAVQVGVNMGAALLGSGVTIMGMCSVQVNADANMSIHIMRMRDGAPLSVAGKTCRGGATDQMVVFAYDPAPVTGVNNYQVVVFTPAGRSGIIEASGIVATGGKR